MDDSLFTEFDTNMLNQWRICLLWGSINFLSLTHNMIMACFNYWCIVLFELSDQTTINLTKTRESTETVSDWVLVLEWGTSKIHITVMIYINLDPTEDLSTAGYVQSHRLMQWKGHMNMALQLWASRNLYQVMIF